MKTIIAWYPIRFLLLSLLAVSGIIPRARAGLTVDVNLYHDTYGYFFYPYLSTNTTPPAIPLGHYQIASWQIPTNGSQLQYQATAGAFDYVTGGGNYYNDFASLMYAITNRPWSVLVTNATSTNLYTFGVTVSGFDSNSFGAPATITYPAAGQPYVSSLPQFAWTGPAAWAGTLTVEDDWIDSNDNYNYVDSDFLSPNTSIWTPSVILPNGSNSFSVYYDSNITVTVVAATPTNAVGQPISGWISTAQMDSSASLQFSVGTMPMTGSTGHTNVAYYSFEDGSLFSQDFSGHGNNIGGYGWFATPPYLTNDAIAGSYAVGYTGSGWQSPPTNLVSVLAGNFSVSLWLRTSDTPGNDSDTADTGAGILAANSDQVIPMAQTGSKLAFLTGGNSSDTLHSTSAINNGSYTHVVVTRNQTTGEKKIYVNGVLDASDFGDSGILTAFGDPSLYLGMNSTFAAGFVGDVDEVQIYSGVLSADEVTQLYNNPGTTIPDATASAGNGIVAHYDFDEGTALAPDVSSNGNDIVQTGNFGGSNPVIDPNAIAGVGSVSFDGTGYLTPPSALLSTLAGSFSVSVWVNTTQNFVSDPGFFDASGIISADIPGGYNDVIPIGMDEFGDVVFNTGNTDQGYDDEMYSYGTVNDGSWHHIVVTRDQTTGDKNIYIDGALDGASPEPGTTNDLSDPVLLTIGALADASNPDPTSPSYTGDNGYQGLLDDVQFYGRVLNSNEVAYLYNNPGSAISATGPLAPVSVDMTLNIYREQDSTFGDIYVAFPSFNSVTPQATGTTTNLIQSPNGDFTAQADQGGGSSGSYILNSLDQVLNECTNGNWTLTINQGQLNQQQFHFQVSISGLNTNLLAPVVMVVPTNGATGVPTNTPIQWLGLSGFSSVSVSASLLPTYLGEGNASLPSTATNWPSPPALGIGTNQVNVEYILDNFPTINFTIPVDVSLNQVSNWVAQANLHSTATIKFVTAVAPQAIQLLNPHLGNGGLQFSFQTQNSQPETIAMRTNLISGAWIPVTNFTGDGTLRQFTFPLTNGPAEFFRVTSP